MLSIILLTRRRTAAGEPAAAPRPVHSLGGIVLVIGAIFCSLNIARPGRANEESLFYTCLKPGVAHIDGQAACQDSK
ncbi:MAG: hypothetical protein WBJ12_08645 [Dethiobacteria bacterium]